MAAKKKEQEDKSKKTPKESDGNQEDRQSGSDFVSRSEYNKLQNELQQVMQWAKGTTEVVETLASDPQLTAAFRESYSKRTGQQLPTQQPQQVQNQASNTGNNGDAGKQTPYDPRIDEVTAANRNKIVTDFESRYGIDKLPEEERASVRKQVAEFIGEFGHDITTVPLSRLDKTLDRAYVATHAEKLREEGKMEGFVQARTNQQGVMSQVSGGAPHQESHESDLTPAQKEWAKKLGVDPEKARETYLNRDKEETRVSKAEVKDEE